MTANGDTSCRLASFTDKTGQLKAERVIPTLCTRPHIVPIQCAVHLLDWDTKKSINKVVYMTCALYSKSSLFRLKLKSGSDDLSLLFTAHQ